MTQPTSPDNIAKWTLADPSSIVQASQTQGDSVQTALDKRQRYDYVWANAAARTAQTGMVQSSRGYQTDTKSEYIYDNSNWRLAVSYAEYTAAGQSIPNNVYTGVLNLAIDSGASTDSTFTSISSNVLTIVNPGIYAMSMTSKISSPGSSPFSTITFDGTPPPTNWISIAPYTQSVSTVSIPFVRISAANTPLYLWTFQNSGSSQPLASVVLRVGRIA